MRVLSLIAFLLAWPLSMLVVLGFISAFWSVGVLALAVANYYMHKELGDGDPAFAIGGFLMTMSILLIHLILSPFGIVPLSLRF